MRIASLLAFLVTIMVAKPAPVEVYGGGQSNATGQDYVENIVLTREWAVWGNPVGYVTCEGAGLDAFAHRTLVDAAQLGRAVGDATTAARFERAAGELAADTAGAAAESR